MKTVIRRIFLMISSPFRRFSELTLFFALICLFAAAFLLLPLPALRGQATNSSQPWSASQALQPADLARALADKSSPRPTIICVGFHTLFAGGHVPGASFHGPGSSEAGLADLKKAVESLPRSSEIILYCGCCPLDHCPNVRPAFSALNSMGFKKLRVLILPVNFATDWVGKGYAMERGL